METDTATRTGTRKLRPGSLALTFAGCFGLFTLFVEKFSAPELVLAGLSAAFCTGFGVLLFQCAPKLQFAFADVAQGWRVPGYILQRVAQITWLLLRDLCGKQVSSIFRDTGFKGAEHDPRDCERRVLATLYTTAAPNFIVLQIDPGEHKLYFHQLTRNDPSAMLQNLGADA